MKRSLAYITAAWRGDPAVDMEQAAHYCRVVYDAGYSPICPMLYLPLFLNDAVPEGAQERHRHGPRSAPALPCAGGMRPFRDRGHEK